MPWPMSCPPGEGRSQGEGAASSHWASIILLVAVPPCADRTSGRRTCLGGGHHPEPWLTPRETPRSSHCPTHGPFTEFTLGVRQGSGRLLPCLDLVPRSEERRVGKECRTRWSA